MSQLKARGFNSQTIEMSNNPSCLTNKALQIKTDKVSMHDGKINMPDYFRASVNKAAERRVSKVLTKKFIINSVMKIINNSFKTLLETEKGKLLWWELNPMPLICWMSALDC